MNRNVESHFSMLPSANISRSRFDRSQDIKFTFDVGQVIPFFWDQVYPGDTFDVTTSKVIRLQTLLTPVMDNIYLDTYFFFVPYRLVHFHWREIMGENTQSAWLPETEYTVPQIICQKAAVEGGDDDDTNAAVATGDILDYLGVPVDVSSASDNDNPFSFMAYPLRAYWLTIQEWFRDENLVDPPNWSNGDADQTYQDIVNAELDKPFVAAKFHDYFTSALPNCQANDTPVKIPAGWTSTVNGVDTPGWPVVTPVAGENFETLSTENRNGLTWRRYADYQGNVSGGYNTIDGTAYQTMLTRDKIVNGYWPSNLFASPASNQETGLFMYVSDLRYAFQLQKLYERDARGGRRYIELIRSHFGISSPDSRLQRPEYLGGNRIPISIHQITNQSQGENDFLGDLGAMSLTTDKHSDFVYSATEHGVILGLCVARYDHSYSQALERIWSPKSRFDFYWPVFANLSEQAILKKEICANGTSSDDEVFGFQERWAELRYKPNRTAGEMRPGIANTLSSWHFSDYYTDVPTLSAEWIQEDKTNVDRALAVTSSVSNQIFCDIYVKNYTTRPMPLYSIPGLIDHL